MKDVVLKRINTAVTCAAKLAHTKVVLASPKRTFTFKEILMGGGMEDEITGMNFIDVITSELHLDDEQLVDILVQAEVQCEDVMKERLITKCIFITFKNKLN